MNGRVFNPGTESKGRSLLRDECGAVAIMFAVLLNVILGMVALAIDGGRGMRTDTAIAAAADPGALAGAITDGDFTEVEKYFLANLEPGMYGIDFSYTSNVTAEIVDNNVVVSPTGFIIPTLFAGTLNTQGQAGGNTLGVSGGAAVSMNSEEGVVSDIVFILDVSGSMTGSNIAALQEAVYAGLDKIKEANENNPNALSAVSVTSYATAVQYPPDPFTTDIQSVIDIMPVATLLGENTCGSCSLAEVPGILPGATNDVIAVILFTDGYFNRTINGIPEYFEEPHDEVKEYCDIIKAFDGGDRVSFWSIGYGYAATSSEETLIYCASTPEQYLTADDAEGLNAIYNQIIHELNFLRITK